MWDLEAREGEGGNIIWKEVREIGNGRCDPASSTYS